MDRLKFWPKPNIYLQERMDIWIEIYEYMDIEILLNWKIICMTFKTFYSLKSKKMPMNINIRKQKTAVHLQAITSNVYLCFIWNNIISNEFQTNSTFWIYKKKVFLSFDLINMVPSNHCRCAQTELRIYDGIFL